MIEYRGHELGTVSEVLDGCRALDLLDHDPEALGALALGDGHHTAPYALRTEAKVLIEHGLHERLAHRMLVASGFETKQVDAKRSRPEKIVSGPWKYQTEPEFPMIGSDDRDHVRAVNETRMKRAEDAIYNMLLQFYERQMEVVLARLKGKQGRKGTRHWDYGDKELPAGEIKAINPARVLDVERWRDEVTTDGRSVLENLYLRTAADVGEDVRIPGQASVDFSADSVFATDIVQNAIRDKIKYLMASTDHRAQQVMDVILRADSDGADLAEIVRKVIGAYDQRKIWAKAPSQVLAAGSVNESSMLAALSLGVTYKQWISSRDDRVRFAHTHIGGGDGQIVGIKNRFLIGGFPLAFPGDPSGLPASGPQVYGCRCSLRFAKPPRGTDPVSFDPLELFEGAPEPIYDSPDDLVRPEFDDSASASLLMRMLGLNNSDVRYEFMRRGWRSRVVSLLKGAAAAWLASKAVGAPGSIMQEQVEEFEALLEEGEVAVAVRRAARQWLEGQLNPE